MNVLLITVRADLGGGPQNVNYIVEGLSSKVNLFIACPEDKPFFLDWKAKLGGQKIFILPHRKFSFAKFFSLVFYCLANKIQVVHSHGKGAGIYSRLLKCCLFKLKVIHTFHGIHIADYSEIVKFFYIKIEKVLSNFTNCFINVSTGERDLCLKLELIKEKNSRVVFNGVRTPIKYFELDHIEAKEEKIILTVTRFDYQKNMHLALNIAKRVFDLDPSILFYWVGDGNTRQELEEKAPPNVVFLGFVNHPQKYYALSYLYLSTSRWEGLPYSLIEASSYGLPIIATDVIGNNEVVKHGYNGYLFNESMLEFAVEYIMKLIRDQGLHRLMANESRKLYQSQYSIDFFTDSIYNVYLSV